MTDIEHAYVETRDADVYVWGTRVPLESLIWLWRDGHSAEAIREAYSTLSLAQVYGAIAYYLDHTAEIERQLATGKAQYESQRAAAETADPVRYATLRQRFAVARERRTAAQPSAS